MSEPEMRLGPDGPVEVIRLTKEEFLAQLDTANDWMLWVNPDLDEVELIVKDADGKMTVFHGPDPMSMEPEDYKAFCIQVEKMSDVKGEDPGGG